jgi:hypothetical protein
MTEWNIGCERCHGPGEALVGHPTRDNILNPALFYYVHANDTCRQPLSNPIQEKYYDWPVGFEAAGSQGGPIDGVEELAAAGADLRIRRALSSSTKVRMATFNSASEKKRTLRGRAKIHRSTISSA